MRQEPDKTAFMAKVYDAAWTQSANGQPLPHDIEDLIHDPDVLLAAWLGFLTGQMHASGAPRVFRSGWVRGNESDVFIRTVTTPDGQVYRPDCGAHHPDHPGTRCRQPEGHRGEHATFRRDVTWDNAYLSASEGN